MAVDAIAAMAVASAKMLLVRRARAREGDGKWMDVVHALSACIFSASLYLRYHSSLSL